ncbi:MAG: amino acid adenylation domain-containing protein [Xanthomonadaceae bacterium]|nr:amino acid adenylation domain-containing protein [Xanthomonadaceae bacterium]
MSISFNPEIFSQAQAAELAGQFGALLTAFDGLSLPLFSLPMLSAAAREHWLTAGRCPAVTEAATLTERFESAVKRRPDHPAVVTSTGTLSYTELDQAANRLAHYLNDLGVEPGVIVAIVLPRGRDQVTALLAVLKQGASYLPLDPSTPPARLGALLEDAGAEVIITGQAHLAVVMAGDVDAELVVLERDAEDIAEAAATRPEVAITPGQPACLIYTSGSTGKPKGVMVSHANLSHYAAAFLDRVALAQDASLAALSTVAADLGYTAVYGALCSGRTLRLLPEAHNLDAAGLAQALRDEPVTALKIVPSHLKALLASEGTGDWLPEVLILGGEALDRTLIETLRQRRPDLRIYNHYGPTEATVGVLCGEVPERIDAAGAPLGEPMAGTIVHVLDPALEPVPPGGEGQLYLGGDGLTLGYHRRAAISAERYIPDPHAVEPGARLYRSGDRVRRNLDGSLTFIGRADDQVKIRGHRVEPGEVAAQLRQAPGVDEAIVLVVDGALRAYLAGRETADYASWIECHLPEPLRPSVSHWLEAFPLTANGKVDRQALSALQLSVVGEQRAPRNAVEEQLLGIWRTLLKNDDLSIDDNFFAVGGDSIITIQLVARARQAGIVITPQQVFETQTVAGLAAVVGAGRQIKAEQGEVMGELPLSPIQARFFERITEQEAHYCQSRLLTVPPDLDWACLREALHSVITHHDALRLVYVREDQAIRAYHLSPAEISVEILSRRVTLPVAVTTPTRAINIAVAEDLAVLKLSECLLRMTWFDRGPDQPGRLSLVIHHLNIDAVSWGILIEDLAAAYQARRRSEAPELPAKSTAYRQWAESLHEYAGHWDGGEEIDYWAGNQSPLTTAEAEVLASYREGDGVNQHQQLDAETTASLIQQARDYYDTDLQTLLLAAFGRAVAEARAGADIVLEMEGHGRHVYAEDHDVSRTIGWFTAIYPLRLAGDPMASPAKWVYQVHSSLKSVPGRGVGYGTLCYLETGAGAAGATLRAAACPPYKFNYFGQLSNGTESDFSIAPEFLDGMHGARQRKHHLMELNVAVIDGCLHLLWRYPAALATVWSVRATACSDWLRGVARAAGDGVRYADLAAAGLDEESFDELLDELG